MGLNKLYYGNFKNSPILIFLMCLLEIFNYIHTSHYIFNGTALMYIANSNSNLTIFAVYEICGQLLLQVMDF